LGADAENCPVMELVSTVTSPVTILVISQVTEPPIAPPPEKPFSVSVIPPDPPPVPEQV